MNSAEKRANRMRSLPTAVLGSVAMTGLGKSLELPYPVVGVLAFGSAIACAALHDYAQAVANRIDPPHK